MDKEAKKVLRRNAGWIFLRSSTFLFGSLPLSFGYAVGSFLGWLMYIVLARHRRNALRSLRVAFGELSDRERKKIARDFFIFLSQGALEILYFLRNPRRLDDVRVEGLTHLQDGLNKGKGVILLTAHLGNFPLLSLKLANLGYAVNFVARPMRDAKTGDYLHQLRTAAGVKTILSYPRRACVSAILEALRKNEIVFIQMDQNFGTGGVWVRFFGKLAATPVGPIIFGLRAGAAIIPAYIFREARGKHCIRVFPREPLKTAADKDQTILVNAVHFSRVIESWIRQVPSQWGWVHRRWKSEPSEQVMKQRFKVEA